VGRDGESYSVDLVFGKTEIFLQRGLDRQVTSQLTDLPVRLAGASPVMTKKGIVSSGQKELEYARCFSVSL
jgi:hypothetical protein